MNQNIFVGAAHVADQTTVFGGASLSQGHQVLSPLHIDTTPMPLGTDQVLLITTATDSDGTITEVARCDFTLTLIDGAADPDSDGLLDSWETGGLDADGDGTIDPSRGDAPHNAHWDRKDIFVEVAWKDTALGSSCGVFTQPALCTSQAAHSHRPRDGVLDAVTAAFAAAPVSNPDGSSGITLHPMLDEAVPEIRGARGSHPLSSTERPGQGHARHPETGGRSGKAGTSWSNRSATP